VYEKNDQSPQAVAQLGTSTSGLSRPRPTDAFFPAIAGSKMDENICCRYYAASDSSRQFS